jgi:uncharacterized protein (DUF362 family)
MLIDSTNVALLRCGKYLRREISAAVERICGVLKFKIGASTRVLLKPNLLSSRSADHLACTQPEFVAAVAEWFVEQGAVVAIGDSPGFGTARGVMRATGIERALAGLPVELLDFDQAIPVTLAGGVRVKVARAALECDILVNLPRVKAHSQFYMTLAVKNYFGAVVGLQKPAWHLRYGDREDRFASHLIDLLAVLPAGITFMDGIIAMHETGPILGKPFPLGLVAGTFNPVAADAALLATIGLDLTKSVIWRECARRDLAGVDPDELVFPLLKPQAFTADGFQVPSTLKPVTFNPFRMVVSSCRRFAAGLKESP